MAEININISDGEEKEIEVKFLDNFEFDMGLVLACCSSLVYGFAHSLRDGEKEQFFAEFLNGIKRELKEGHIEGRTSYHEPSY